MEGDTTISTREGFRFTKRKFRKLIEAKIKEGVFQGLQIRKMMLDYHFKKRA